MAYTRNQLLAAVRTDHPEFKGIDDGKLFAALSTDHPDMVKGISNAASAVIVPQSPVTSADTGLGALRNIAASAGEMMGATPTIAGTAKGFGATLLNIPQMMFGGGMKDTIQPGEDFDPLGDVKGLYHSTIGRMADGVSTGDPYEISGGIGASAPFYGVGKAAIKGTPGAIKAALPAEDSLMGGAATARSAVSKIPAGTGIPLSKAGIAVQAAKTVVRPIVNTGASVAEGIARWKAGKNTNVATASAPELKATGEFISKPNPAYVAADEAARLAEARANPQQIPLTETQATAPPLAVPRPVSPPQFIQDMLDRFRQAETPEQLYERQKQARDASAPEGESTSEKVGIEKPLSPRPGLMDEILGERSGGVVDAPAVNKWMGVRPEEVAHGANPGQRLIAENLIGETKEATKANVDAALKSAGQEMEARLKFASDKGVKVDAQTPVYDAYGKAVKRIGAPQDAAFQKQIQGVVDDIEAKYPNLDKLSPTETHRLKVELGDAIKWKGEAYSDPVNQMMIQIYRDLNSAIKTNVDGIGPSQARWGDLYISSKGLKSGIAKDLVGKGTGPAAKIRK